MWLGTIAHTFNHNTREAEAGRFEFDARLALSQTKQNKNMKIKHLPSKSTQNFKIDNNALENIF